MNNFIEHKAEVRCGGSSWCTHCGKAWDTGDRDPPGCSPVVDVSFIGKVPYRANKVSSDTDIQSGHTAARTEVALIGFLTAKLACYEPDSDTVKRAMEYLKCHT